VDNARPGKAIENVDSWAFLLSLKATNVGAIDCRIEGKPFLREASPHPGRPQIPRH